MCLGGCLWEEISHSISSSVCLLQTLLAFSVEGSVSKLTWETPEIVKHKGMGPFKIKLKSVLWSMTILRSKSPGVIFTVVICSKCRNSIAYFSPLIFRHLNISIQGDWKYCIMLYKLGIVISCHMPQNLKILDYRLGATYINKNVA